LRGLLLKGGSGRGVVEERDKEGREGKGEGRDREGPSGTCSHTP